MLCIPSFLNIIFSSLDHIPWLAGQPASIRLSTAYLHYRCQEATDRSKRCYRILSFGLPSGPFTAPSVWETVDLELCLCSRASCQLSIWFSLQKRKVPSRVLGILHFRFLVCLHLAHLCSCSELSQGREKWTLGWLAEVGCYHLYFTLSQRFHPSVFPVMHDEFLKSGIFLQDLVKEQSNG